MFAPLRRSFFNIALKRQPSISAPEFSAVLNSLHYHRFPQQQRTYNSACNMSKSAMVILAPGAEEMEFTIAADVLRRAGVQVCVAGLNGAAPVKCSRDVVIVPDAAFEQAKAKKYDVIILPGGLGGSKAMVESNALGAVLKQQENEGRIVAAICAAPLALAAHDIFKGKNLTSYPAMKAKLENDYTYVEGSNVVQDGNLITSRGPGTAFDFGLKIAEVLMGADKAQEVAKAMLLA